MNSDHLKETTPSQVNRAPVVIDPTNPEYDHERQILTAIVKQFPEHVDCQKNFLGQNGALYPYNIQIDSSRIRTLIQFSVAIQRIKRPFGGYRYFIDSHDSPQIKEIIIDDDSVTYADSDITTIDLMNYDITSQWPLVKQALNNGFSKSETTLRPEKLIIVDDKENDREIIIGFKQTIKEHNIKDIGIVYEVLDQSSELIQFDDDGNIGSFTLRMINLEDADAEDKRMLAKLIDTHLNGDEIKLEKAKPYLANINGQSQAVMLSHSVIKRPNKSNDGHHYQILGGKQQRIGTKMLNGKAQPKGCFGTVTISLGKIDGQTGKITLYPEEQPYMIVKRQIGGLQSPQCETLFTKRRDNNKAFGTWRRMRNKLGAPNKYKHYLIMKYKPGVDLDDIDPKEITAKFIIKFAEELFKSINELYDIGLVHCDIKPSNIRVEWNKVTGEMKVHIIDNGVMVDKDTSLPYRGGTPIYTAQEILLAQPCLASMVFSAAVVIGELAYKDQLDLHEERWGNNITESFFKCHVKQLIKNNKELPRFKFNNLQKIPIEKRAQLRAKLLALTVNYPHKRPTDLDNIIEFFAQFDNLTPFSLTGSITYGVNMLSTYFFRNPDEPIQPTLTDSEGPSTGIVSENAKGPAAQKNEELNSSWVMLGNNNSH